MRVNVNESCDSFRQLRENHAYYIDKTDMLQEYLVDHFKSAVLFARPRRFGKTLTMTMFRDFLDVRQNSRALFENLEIMNHQDTVKRFMNRYPVVFFSLKEVFGKDFDAVMGNFRLAVSALCKAFPELSDSMKTDVDDRELFAAIKSQKASAENTIAVFDLLTRMLRSHYGMPAFIIIDEYDVPMAKAVDTPAYEDVRDLVAHMLSYVCKTNENVKAVMLSGCLYTVKNSTYTGVNNIVPYTVLSPNYASSIGFTDEDVKKLLADAGMEDALETVREWYDGYIFGRDRMYCPWDVLQYVSAVLDGSYSDEMGPESYWLNTSETSLELIQGFLGKTANVTENFEQLLAGKTIDCTVNDSLPYHRIHESGENLWSALLETGYLTKAVKERMPRMPLRIPNKGIQTVFRQEVWAWLFGKSGRGSVF